MRERANKLRSTFGITPEEYDALLAAQGGGCALCGTTRDVDRRLAVDHNHDCCPGMRSCGRCVRGLLCGLCNKGLGQFGSSPERLRKAADYLEVAAMERHINVTYQKERIHDEANC